MIAPLRNGHRRMILLLALALALLFVASLRARRAAPVNARMSEALLRREGGTR